MIRKSKNRITNSNLMKQNITITIKNQNLPFLEAPNPIHITIIKQKNEESESYPGS